MTGLNAYNPQGPLCYRPRRNPIDWCGSGPRTQPVIDDRHSRHDYQDCQPRFNHHDSHLHPFRCRPGRDWQRLWPGSGGEWQGGWLGGWQGRPVYPSIDDRHNHPIRWSGGGSLAEMVTNWGSGYHSMAERAELLNLHSKGTYRNLVMHSTPNSHYFRGESPQ